MDLTVEHSIVLRTELRIMGKWAMRILITERQQNPLKDKGFALKMGQRRLILTLTSSLQTSQRMIVETTVRMTKKVAPKRSLRKEDQRKTPKN